jgi:hypothetical protein
MQNTSSDTKPIFIKDCPKCGDQLAHKETRLSFSKRMSHLRNSNHGSRYHGDRRSVLAVLMSTGQFKKAELGSLYQCISNYCKHKVLVPLDLVGDIKPVTSEVKK